MRSTPYAPGRMVAGRYRIESVIASGAAGWVFAARDLKVDIDVALKVVTPALLADTARQAAFLATVRSCAALHHPNWVRIYDVGADGPQFYYTMLLLESLTLRSVMDVRAEQGRHFGPMEALPLLRQLVQALAALTAVGPHAALRPSSIVVLSDLLKITGLPHHRGVERGGFIEAVRAQGMLSYLAPEALERDTSVDSRADTYSLSAMMVELLTGQRFTGELSSLAEVCAELPHGLARALTGGLAPRPDERAETPQVLLAALEEAAAAAPSPAPESVYIGRVVPSAPMSSVVGRRPWVRPRLLVGVGAGLALIVGVLLWHDGGGVSTDAPDAAASAPVKLSTTEVARGTDAAGWDTAAAEEETNAAEAAAAQRAKSKPSPSGRVRKAKARPDSVEEKAAGAAEVSSAAAAEASPPLPAGQPASTGARLPLSPPPPPPPPALPANTVPVLISGPPITYTQEAALAGIEGDMAVRCTITETGVVRGCEVLVSLPYLDRAVVKALQARTYKPATRGGYPVATEYTFNLHMVLR